MLYTRTAESTYILSFWPSLHRLLAPIRGSIAIRVRKGNRIGHMYYYSLVLGERYYLRLLLIVVRGPRSFADLYTVNSICYPTY